MGNIQIKLLLRVRFEVTATSFALKIFERVLNTDYIIPVQSEVRWKGFTFIVSSINTDVTGDISTEIFCPLTKEYPKDKAAKICQSLVEQGWTAL